MNSHNPYLQPSAQTVCTWPGYLYFVHERESVRLLKSVSVAPWTKDPVLQKYRFTNIRRRDDRMTKWFIEHLILPNRNSAELWFTLLIGRLINWPPTLQALIENRVLPCSPSTFDAARFVSVIEALPGKRYGGAYMVYPTMRNPGGVKSQSLAEHIIGDVIKHYADVNHALWDAEMGEPCLERFVTALSQCFGISTFIAGQVAADLTYDLAHLGNAVDLYTWAPLGPGSQRGLNFLHGKPVNHAWAQAEFNAALGEAGTMIVEELGIGDMTLHDVQNTACEFSKYVKAVQGLGKPKSTYKPETEY